MSDKSAAPQQIDIRLETITPKMAEEYLKKNPSNRGLRLRRVREYAAQMNRGQWQMAGDPIRFSEDGTLIDGQHRLHAVMVHGSPVQFVVIRNVNPATFTVIDSGLMRSPGDALGGGVQAASHKAASARLLFVLETGGDPRKSEERTAVTRADLHDYYEAHAAEMDEAWKMGSILYNAIHGNRSAWITLACLTGRINPMLRNQFFNSLRTGAGLNPGDPRLALRNWLSKRANITRDLESGEHLMMYIRAWNDWMSGTKRSVMRAPLNDDKFPQIATTTKESLL